MAVKKTNLALTLLVTVGLVAGLFILFPSSVQAATVTNLSAGSITAAGGDFTVTAVIDVPDGEHIPVSQAAVWTVPVSVAHGGDLVTGGGTQCAGATIIDIQTSLEFVEAGYAGQGYSHNAISDLGFGYGYSYGYSFDYGASDFAFGGSGYGYGYGSGGGDITVTVRATGCSGVTFSGAVAFYDVQVLVGDATQQLASLPLTVAFVDPAAVGTPVLISDSSGFTLAGGPLTAGDTLTVSLDGIAGMESVEVTLQSGADLPPGTKFRILQNLDPSTPGFGVSAADVLTQFLGQPLAFQFFFQVEDVDGNPIDVNGRIRIDLTLTVPDSYFDSAVGTINKNTLRVRAYDADGESKGTHPGVISGSFDTDTWTYVVRITHFSSFAGAAVATVGGGGGGGGGTTDTTTDTDTDTSTVTDTTTDTGTDTVTDTTTDTGTDTQPEDTTTETETGRGNNQTPSVGVLGFVALLGAAYVVVRRRL